MVSEGAIARSLNAGEMGFRIAPGHEPARYAEEFQRNGRVQISGFLREEDAQQLYRALSERARWNLTLLHDMPRDIPMEKWTALPEQQRMDIDRQVIEAARTRFEGRYCTMRLSNHGEPFGGDVPELVALTRFLNSEPFFAFMRALTGCEEIALTDAQGTLYLPGHFLLNHDDSNSKRKHLAAYVLNLTPRWNAEWGGLLCFLDEEGRVAQTYTPAWNVINVLKVPQPHFVSFVAPYASAARCSVTGWMRAALSENAKEASAY
jgi:SM-20-related protein